MVEISTGKLSPLAMFLSMLCPGLGQIYLGKYVKALVIFLAAVMGIVLIYVNTLPFNDFSDLLKKDSESKEYTIWTFKSGRTLMFKSRWQFRLTGFIQFVCAWLYGVADGLAGRRMYRRTILKPFKKKQKVDS